MSNFPISKKPASIFKESNLRNPFLSLQTSFDTAMDKAMRDFYDMFQISSNFGQNNNLITINPSIDIVEDKNSFKIEAEMPGLDEKDIKVSLNDGILRISGEKTISKKDENINYISREINYGRYERSIALPDSADADKAKATFKKGMLWIHIPKKAEAAKLNRELPIEKAT